MSESFALAPTWGDGIALEMYHPSLAWLHADIPTVVNIAQLQPHESALILSCGTGLLAREVGEFAVDVVKGLAEQ